MRIVRSTRGKETESNAVHAAGNTEGLLLRKIQKEKKKCPLERRGLDSLAEEAAVAAAAEKKDNPDPVTAKAVSTAKAVVMFTSTSIVAAAAAAQDKDQPDDIAPASSCITVTVAVTSAVCCCQIAHTSSSKNYLQFIICRPACHSFRFF